MDVGPWLPLRAEKIASVAPESTTGSVQEIWLAATGDTSGLARSLILARVSDADADRLLDPLVSGGPPMESHPAVYIAAPIELARVLAAFGLPAEAAGQVGWAPVWPAPPCLLGMVLVRESAAEKLGLRTTLAAPNAVMIVLPHAGTIEDAMARLKAPCVQQGLAARPFDLPIADFAHERLVGLAGLVLMLAGGSLLAATGLRAAGRINPGDRGWAEWFLRGPKLIGVSGPTFGRVLALAMAAIALGAMWGGPGEFWDMARQATAEPLAATGATSSPVGADALLNAVVMTFLTNLLLWALVIIAVPSLVPGLGIVTCLVHNFFWGVVLAPATLTLLDRMPLRAAVAGVVGVA